LTAVCAGAVLLFITTAWYNSHAGFRTECAEHGTVNVAGADSVGRGIDGGVDITVLYDNYVCTQGTKADWGFSCIIQGTEQTILFDTGTKPSILAANINILEADLSEVKTVVLSHSHRDHTGGLGWFLEKNSHVKVVMPCEFSSSFTNDISEAGAVPVIAADAGPVCTDVFVSGCMGDRIKEQCLVINMKKGLIIVTGCSHPGIVSMIRKVRKEFSRPVYAVIGGFHLMSASDAEVETIIQAFRDLGVEKVGATHCTGDRQISIFKTAYAGDYLPMGTGRVLKF